MQPGWMQETLCSWSRSRETGQGCGCGCGWVGGSVRATSHNLGRWISVFLFIQQVFLPSAFPLAAQPCCSESHLPSSRHASLWLADLSQGIELCKTDRAEGSWWVPSAGLLGLLFSPATPKGIRWSLRLSHALLGMGCICKMYLGL